MALIAKAHAYSVARISLSWLLAKPVVTSVIIGAKRLDQSEENLAAVEVQLTEDELKLLDQVTALRPNIPVGCSPLTAPAVWESLTVLFGTICVSLRARHSDYAERLVLITLVLIDAAKIRASEVRKQKTDERDARLILDLMLAKRFPKIWVPTPGERDFRQLLWHRHKLVCLRTTLGNQLHALAMSQGLCRKKKLFTKKGRGELTSLTLGFWASRRRAELLKLLDQVEAPVGELDRAVLDEAQRREEAVRLMSHPGVGPITALAFVLTIGPITRFPRTGNW